MAKSSVPCKHAWTTKSGEEWIGLEVCRGCGRTRAARVATPGAGFGVRATGTGRLGALASRRGR